MTSLTTATTSTPVANADLSLTRLNLMRAGYLMMGVGLALMVAAAVGRGIIAPYEGVTLCLLTAMSLLALLGLRHPIKLLPLLLFEAGWKLLWLGLIALPRGLSSDLDEATTEILTNCSLVIVILIVIPWRHEWRSYVIGSGDRWR